MLTATVQKNEQTLILSSVVYIFPVEEISYLDEEKVNSLIKEGQSSGNWHHLIHTIGSVFSNPDSLMQSFRIPSGHSRMEPDPDKDIDDTETEAMNLSLIHI